MAFGRIGHVLTDAYSGHGHAVFGEAARGWSGNREIVETDAELGIGQLTGGCSGRPPRIDLERARAKRGCLCGGPLQRLIEAKRSEEHTSELQSLMRISYAVFCLKKKKEQNKITNAHYHKRTAHERKQ